jgi:hypothetical protein
VNTRPFLKPGEKPPEKPLTNIAFVTRADGVGDGHPENRLRHTPDTPLRLIRCVVAAN